MKLLGETQEVNESTLSVADSAQEQHLEKERIVKSDVIDDFDFNIDNDEGGKGSADAEGQTGSGANIAEKVKAEIAKLAPLTESNSTSNCTVHESLYILLLQVVESYLTLSAQTVTAVKFDLLRLLDDYLPWETTQSCEDARSAWLGKLNPDVLLAILRVLRQQSLSSSVESRWFGSQEDAVKMFINLIVAEDWRSSMKRTVLMKLMVLATGGSVGSTTNTAEHAASGSSTASAQYEEVSKKSRTLLKYILIHSGLFVGHGLVDIELTSELNGWLGEKCLTVTDDAVLVLETLLRLTHHWNTPLSIQASQCVASTSGTGGLTVSYLTQLNGASGSVSSQSSNNSNSTAITIRNTESSETVPYSPLLYCAIQLMTANFDIFAAQLPKYIRTHIPSSGDELQSTSQSQVQMNDSSSASSSSSAFFDKYNAHFRVQVQGVFSSLLYACASQARSPYAYSSAVLAAVQHSLKQQSGGNRITKEGEKNVEFSVSLLVRLTDLSNAHTLQQIGKRANSKQFSEILQAIARSSPAVVEAVNDALSVTVATADAGMSSKKSRKSSANIASTGNKSSAAAIVNAENFASVCAALV